MVSGPSGTIYLEHEYLRRDLLIFWLTENCLCLVDPDAGMTAVCPRRQSRYNTVNMQRHAPKPFYLYIANWLNSTAGMNVVHNAL